MKRGVKEGVVVGGDGGEGWWVWSVYLFPFHTPPHPLPTPNHQSPLQSYHPVPPSYPSLPFLLMLIAATTRRVIGGIRDG